MLLLLWTLITQASTALAEEHFSIYGVHRPLSMEDGAPVVRDYYIDAGLEQGLKSGQKIYVYRRLTTANGMTSEVQHDFLVKIAVLKLIHSEGNASIARLEQMLPNGSSAQVTPPTVIIGDLIGLD
jgi:hypothetical protein